MIKNFNIFFLLESIFKMDPDFIKILQKLKDQSVVAKELYNLIDTDIKLNYNYIKSTDANDMVSFIGDSQVKRNVDQGIDPYTKRSGTVKIGRFIKQIFDFNGIKISDVDISKFVDLYKAAIDFNSNIKSGFKFVKEEDIRYWYNKNNYSRESGSLGSSCMRQSHKSTFFNIYVENPEVCQMLILTDDNNLLKGRALVWKLTSGDYYLDRIYTVNQSDEELFLNYYQEWLTKNHPSSKVLTHKKEDSNLRVKLKKWMFDQYPYVDSLYCLEINDGFLNDDKSRTELGLKDKPTFDLSEQNGEYEQNCEYIEKYGKYIVNNQLVEIDNEYFLRSEAREVYYNYGDYVTRRFVLSKDSIYSEVYSDYLYKPDVVESPEFGLILKGDIIPLYDMIDGKLEKIKDVIKTITLKDRDYILLEEEINKKIIEFITHVKNTVYNYSTRNIQLIPQDMSNYIILYQVSKYDLNNSRVNIHVNYRRSYYSGSNLTYPIFSNNSNIVMLTEEEIKSIEIEHISELSKGISKKEDYYNIFEKYKYKDLVKFLELYFPDSIKMKEILDNANKYLLKNSKRYSINNKIDLKGDELEKYIYKVFFDNSEDLAKKYVEDYIYGNIKNLINFVKYYMDNKYDNKYEPWKNLSDEEIKKDILLDSKKENLIDAVLKLTFEDLTGVNLFYYKYRNKYENYDEVCYNMCRYVVKDKYPYGIFINKEKYEDILLLNDIQDIFDSLRAEEFIEELNKRKKSK